MSPCLSPCIYRYRVKNKYELLIVWPLPPKYLYHRLHCTVLTSCGAGDWTYDFLCAGKAPSTSCFSGGILCIVFKSPTPCYSPLLSPTFIAHLFFFIPSRPSSKISSSQQAWVVAHIFLFVLFFETWFLWFWSLASHASAPNLTVRKDTAQSWWGRYGGRSMRHLVMLCLHEERRHTGNLLFLLAHFLQQSSTS